MSASTKFSFRKVILILFIVACFCGIVYSVCGIVIWNLHAHDNVAIRDELDEMINVPKEVQHQDNQKIDIDFASLKNINKDTVAYVKVNNTNIDYVVVQADDNSYYLNHNFEEKWNMAGWIFADYRNKLDGADKNIIIYGHNTRDGSMFGTLEYILDKNWYENKDNYEVLFVTENGEYRYRVFSVYSIIPEEYYISTEFATENEFRVFAKTLLDRSVYDFGVGVASNDRILTLSSCLGNGEKRVVLHAVLLDD